MSNILHITIMSVDVFGRQLVQAKEVYRGPAGIGFAVTETGDFDIGEKLLCNVAEAKSDLDAVNLKLLNELNGKLLENIFKSMIGFGDELIKKIVKGFRSDLETRLTNFEKDIENKLKILKEELIVDIQENTANIQHIECMMVNGSANCEKPVYSR